MTFFFIEKQDGTNLVQGKHTHSNNNFFLDCSDIARKYGKLYMPIYVYYP